MSPDNMKEHCFWLRTESKSTDDTVETMTVQILSNIRSEETPAETIRGRIILGEDDRSYPRPTEAEDGTPLMPSDAESDMIPEQRTLASLQHRSTG